MVARNECNLSQAVRGLREVLLRTSATKTATHRAHFTQMADEYWLASLRIREELSSDLRPDDANHRGGTNWRSDDSVNPANSARSPAPCCAT